MVSTKKIIATLGVVAGLGVAMLPLASYANTTGQQLVRVRVASTLALTVTPNINSTSDNDNALNMNQNEFNHPTTGDANPLYHDIEVTGNNYGGYELTMGPAENYTNDLRLKLTSGYSDTYKIESLSENGSLAAGDGKWGYRTAVAESYAAASFGNTWNAIPATATKIAEDANASHANFDNHHFVDFGIATSTSQVAGDYETVLEYAVTAKAF